MNEETLIWYINEPYREAVSRAQQLANFADRTVVVVDARSGKAVTRVEPRRGYYETK